MKLSSLLASIGRFCCFSSVIKLKEATCKQHHQKTALLTFVCKRTNCFLFEPLYSDVWSLWVQYLRAFLSASIADHWDGVSAETRGRWGEQLLQKPTGKFPLFQHLFKDVYLKVWNNLRIDWVKKREHLCLSPACAYQPSQQRHLSNWTPSPLLS